MQLGSTFGHWLLANWGGVALTIGALAGAVGLWLTLAPHSLLSLDRRLSVWVPTDHLADALNRRRHSGRFFYRHHRTFGGLLTLGGAFLAYTLLFTLPGPDAWGSAITAVLGAPAALAEPLAFALRVLLALGCALALLLGPIIFFQPSLLRPVEALTDRWVNSEAGLATLNRPWDGTTRWVERHPRWVGGGLLVIGLLIAMSGGA